MAIGAHAIPTALPFYCGHTVLFVTRSGPGMEKNKKKMEPSPHTFLFAVASFLILWLEREGLLKFFCELRLCGSETDFPGPGVKASEEKSPRKTSFLSLSTFRL